MEREGERKAKNLLRDVKDYTFMNSEVPEGPNQMKYVLWLVNLFFRAEFIFVVDK